MKKAILIIFLILILDQILKIWIKTSFYIGESRPVFGHWFYLHFTENEAGPGESSFSVSSVL
jgi:signal peptidase II